MANISNKTDSYTKSRIAGRRLYLALKVKGISRTKTGLFSDKEWLKRNLPKTAKSLSVWFEDGIPIYSKGKDIRPIHAIADYFGIDPKYLINDKEISEEDFLNTIINTPTISESADGNVYKSDPGKNPLIFPSDSATPSVIGNCSEIRKHRSR